MGCAQPDMVEGCIETGRIDRLQQIVEGVNFESFYGVAVIGGHEDNTRETGRRDGPDHFEAIHFGHLDIEQDQADGLAAQERNGVAAGGAFTGHRKIGVTGKQRAQALAGKRLIVDDQGSDAHTAGRNGKARRTQQPPPGALTHSKNES